MPHPLSITFCSYDGAGYFGGPFTWLPRLLEALRTQGIEGRALLLSDHAPEKGYVWQRLQQAGFPCQAMRLHSLTQVNDNAEGQVRWLVKQLRRDRPDVFVANMVTPAYYAARWAREAGIPTVGILHGDDAFHHALVDEFVVGTQAYQLSAMVVVSESLETAVAARDTKGVIVRRIPCMVPIPDRKALPPKEVMRLAYAGRLADSVKRICLVGEAFCRAVREVPGTEAVFYGDGRDRDQLDALLETEGAGLSVRIAGLIPSAQLQDELLGSHVITLMSDSEGLPVALAEGMACGLVPVCRRIRSGIPELVRDGETGLLVDDGVPGFVAAIRRLRNDPELWSRLSANARGLVEGSYATSVVVHRWHELFSQLVEERPRQCHIAVPGQLLLPPRNCSLEGPKSRWPGWPVYVQKQLSRARRQILRLPGMPRS